jgi:hypothetical protein
MIFDADRIEEIRRYAILAGLHAPDRRHFLFFSMNEYEAELPTKDKPSDQVLADLQRMSEDGWVSDVIPLEIWLRNAANLTKLFADRTSFFSQCADEAAKTPKPQAFLGFVMARTKNTTPGAPISPAGPISLDAARKDSLVKTIGRCLVVDDIRTVLQKCFGDLPNLSDGPGEAPLDVCVLALQSIELVERERLTVVFLQFAIGTPRCNDELRKAALEIFPELVTANQPFAAIVDAAAECFKKNATPIAELLGDKHLAEQLSLSVAELKGYKGLHEAIHQVKTSLPPAVPDDNNPADVRDFKPRVRQYLAALNTARARSQGALDELPRDSGIRAAQQPGITLIGGYARRIEAALGRDDIDAVAAALEDAARAIEPMLDEFNQQIFEMARRLLDGPLDRLRSAIAGTLDHAGSQLPVDALRLALLTRVVEHTRWQEVDNSLFSLGGAFQSEPVTAFKKFTRRWGLARKQIPTLTDSDSEIDTAKLQILASRVDTALVEVEKSVASAAGTNKDVFNFVMLEPFDAFRFEAQQQFLMIDSALKRNCAELVRIVPIP